MNEALLETLKWLGAIIAGGAVTTAWGMWRKRLEDAADTAKRDAKSVALLEAGFADLHKKIGDLSGEIAEEIDDVKEAVSGWLAAGDQRMRDAIRDELDRRFGGSGGTAPPGNNGTSHGNVPPLPPSVRG